MEKAAEKAFTEICQVLRHHRLTVQEGIDVLTKVCDAVLVSSTCFVSVNDCETANCQPVSLSAAEPEWLTVQEAAVLLKVHPNTVYEMIKQGKLRALKYGRLLRLPRNGLHQ